MGLVHCSRSGVLHHDTIGLLYVKAERGKVKSVEKVAPVHKKQLLTYLRLTDLKVGYLLNFGDALMKDGIRRIINGTLGA